MLVASGLAPEYADALMTLLVEGRTRHRRLFGRDAIGSVELAVRYQPDAPVRLWTNGADRIHLVLSEERQLSAPTRGGAKFVHGIPHELAHIVMYRGLADLQSLPVGWGEGWAVFASTCLVAPVLWRRHGRRLWPDPYDFRATEGPASLRGREGPGAAPHLEHALQLDRLDRHLGRERFLALVRRPLRRFALADEYVTTLERAFARLPDEDAV